MTIIRGKKSAARIKLTDGLIRQQLNQALAEKGGVIRDAELIGLQVSRVSLDKISFRYDYRLHGQRKNITLGQWPKITVTQARALVKEKALSVANGDSPLDDKQAKKADTQNTLQSYLDHDYKLYMQRAITGDEYIA